MAAGTKRKGEDSPAADSDSPGLSLERTTKQRRVEDEEEETNEVADETSDEADDQTNDVDDKENEPATSFAENEPATSFAELGLHEDLVAVCKARGWETPSPIQAAAIPHALKGRDVIGLAVTGSGKTAAFVLPILQSMLLNKPHSFYSLTVTPTRELANQIAEQFNALGRPFQVNIVTITGGMHNNSQVKLLAKEPHIVVGTPGRLVDHLSNTQGFSLSNTKFLVLDEADRLLTLDFEEELKQIVKACSSKRQTFLFSATMTSRVSKLQKLSLQRPVKVSVDEKTQTAKNLKQFMALVPPAEKFAWTATFLRRVEAYRTIVFCNTCKIANVLNAFLRRLGYGSTCLSGDMQQAFRLGAIRQFKSQSKSVLVTTEVGSRGLDLPEVNYVLNFDVPTNYRDYIHRVGRTARANNHGEAHTLVNQHDAADLAKIEIKIGVRLDPFNEIKASDYALINFTEAKAAAEKEYDEARKKNIFKKKKGHSRA